LKGRSILLLKDRATRFTSAKVREAIFDLLGDITGCTILDLFAGSGVFAIEALSRGAVRATCVEIDEGVVRRLLENLRGLSLHKCCDVLTMDVRYAIPFLYKGRSTYDIIFMDPPYEKGHVMDTMLLLGSNRLHGNYSTLVVEHSKREVPDISSPEGWSTVTQRRYGDTGVTVLRVDEQTIKRSFR